ncbi:MAG: lipoprotein-releasing system ATP-binding protein [Actinomycetota bacterium]|jgi:ABC-type lipoprotein export system ATPase subunit|nr:lipoprotein-releasing system ATP-binding protein [Actinomycetota bacterium]
MTELVSLGRAVRRVFPSGDTQRVALDTADFDIEMNESIALVGPSGSGKTTLLHLLAGLDAPSSGQLTWPALGPKEALRPRKVAVAFQGPTLLPALTVIENVALPLLLMGKPEDESLQAAGELLARFELGDLPNKFPDQISGGQSQRAGLARALITRPRLVLLDEPTGQQDHSTAARVLGSLLELLDETGAAAVVATHDESIVARFPRRWSLDGGHLFAEERIRCSA